MAQEDHLTIEHLSAYLDRQLSAQEQAECDVHLQGCRQCRSQLADLRRTVSLLHALPQPELPRSFVLPARTLSVVASSERRSAPTMPITRSRANSWQNYLRRSTRVISTIAAVLGVIFIMSSLLTGLLSVSHGGAATSASAPSYSTVSNQPAVPAPASASVTSPGHNPRGTATSDQAGAVPSTFGSNSGNSTPPTAVPTPANSQQPLAPVPSVPPILDLGMPVGRLGLGFILLILGIVGVVFSRRRSAGG